MSEILDLKNHVTAMSSKMNHIVDMVRNSFTVNDKMNELLALMHNIGLTNQNKNQDIFDCILPDLISRMGSAERQINTKQNDRGIGDHVDFYVGKGKRKRKVHMIIKEDGIALYTDKKSFFLEL